MGRARNFEYFTKVGVLKQDGCTLIPANTRLRDGDLPAKCLRELVESGFVVGKRISDYKDQDDALAELAEESHGEPAPGTTDEVRFELDTPEKLGEDGRPKITPEVAVEVPDDPMATKGKKGKKAKALLATEVASAEGKWNLDPSSLGGKDLDGLNVMIHERDSAAPVFETVEEARAFLSQDHKG